VAFFAVGVVVAGLVVQTLTKGNVRWRGGYYSTIAKIG
jgi:hypothetical protein